MQRIRPLPPLLANQIAAGEVVERPASIVKELLENAADAKSSQIRIQVAQGGLNLIEVSDDGEGILADDLPLALTAQATSKISRVEDLSQILSLGFRGEALASIAAISRLRLKSKPACQETAMMIEKDEQGERISACARQQGTTVEARDIFYNIPVRKRFLKSPSSEFQAIDQVVRRFALSASSIGLNFYHNERNIFQLPAAKDEPSTLLRIQKLLGKNFLESALFFDLEHAGMHLYGWLSHPDYQRSQNDQQWIYINQRMVKDKLIQHALKQAYDDFLYPGRHPSCLLYFFLAPSEVDVNVHPSKQELRFLQSRLVHDFILSSLKKVLQDFNCSSKVEPSNTEGRTMNRQVYASPIAPLQEERQLRSDFIALNNQFSLLFLGDLPYLVNILEIQKQYLSMILRAQKLPLEGRKLFVPFRCSLNGKDKALLKEIEEPLQKLGFSLQFLESDLVIQSIPIALPHLDLKKLLTSLCQQHFNFDFDQAQLSLDLILELLPNMQSIQANIILEEQAEVLKQFIQDDLEKGHFKSCYRPLSPSSCQRFFYD